MIRLFNSPKKVTLHSWRNCKSSLKKSLVRSRGKVFVFLKQKTLRHSQKQVDRVTTSAQARRIKSHFVRNSYPVRQIMFFKMSQGLRTNTRLTIKV